MSWGLKKTNNLCPYPFLLFLFLLLHFFLVE